MLLSCVSIFKVSQFVGKLNVFWIITLIITDKADKLKKYNRIILINKWLEGIRLFLFQNQFFAGY